MRYLYIFVVLLLLVSCTPALNTDIKIDLTGVYEKSKAISVTSVRISNLVNSLKAVAQEYDLKEWVELNDESIVIGFIRVWPERADSKLANPSHPWILTLVLYKPKQENREIKIRITESQILDRSEIGKNLQASLINKLKVTYSDTNIKIE